MIYILGTVATLILSMIAMQGKRQWKEKERSSAKAAYLFFAMLSMVPLTLISAVRFDVGTDFDGYYKIYLFPNLFPRLEKGFLVLVNAMRRISADPQFFFVVSSVMICGLVFFVTYKESTSVPYSLLLFVICRDYFRSMNGVRQYIAIAVAMLALKYLKEKSGIKFFCIVLLATTIHSVAAVFFLLYLLDRVVISPTNVLMIVFSLFAAGGAFVKIVYPIIDKYTEYGRYFQEGSGYSESDFSAALLLIYLAMFVVATLMFRQRNANTTILYNSLFICLCVSVMTAFMPTNVSRITWVLNPVISLYWPEAVKKIPKAKLRLLVNIGVIVGYTLLTSYFIVVKGNQDVLPYQFFWS